MAEYLLIQAINGLVIGIIYTLPNFFPEVPAVQLSTSNSNIKIDASTLQTVEDALKAASIPYNRMEIQYSRLVAMLTEPPLQPVRRPSAVRRRKSRRSRRSASGRAARRWCSTCCSSRSSA